MVKVTVEVTKRRFVNFLAPGSLYAEESRVETDETDPLKIDVPESAFAFYFSEFYEAMCQDKRLVSQSEKTSGRYYPGGQILTLKDVKREHPEKDILARNMEYNEGWNPAVLTRRGNWQPFEDDDVIL